MSNFRNHNTFLYVAHSSHATRVMISTYTSNISKPCNRTILPPGLCKQTATEHGVWNFSYYYTWFISANQHTPKLPRQVLLQLFLVPLSLVGVHLKVPNQLFAHYLTPAILNSYLEPITYLTLIRRVRLSSSVPVRFNFHTPVLRVALLPCKPSFLPLQRRFRGLLVLIFWLQLPKPKSISLSSFVSLLALSMHYDPPATLPDVLSCPNTASVQQRSPACLGYERSRISGSVA